MNWSTLGAGIGVVMALATGIWQVDGRYAKIENVTQQITDVKCLYLQSENRTIQQQLFSLRVAASQRRLTVLEQQRFAELADISQQVKNQLKRFGCG